MGVLWGSQWGVCMLTDKCPKVVVSAKNILLEWPKVRSLFIFL